MSFQKRPRVPQMNYLYLEAKVNEFLKCAKKSFSKTLNTLQVAFKDPQDI